MVRLTDLPNMIIAVQLDFKNKIIPMCYLVGWERSGSVVECLTRDRRAAGSILTGVTSLCP